METPFSTEEMPPLATGTKRLAHRVLVTCENRFQLFLVEAQEEREHLMTTVWMALVAVGFCLLAGISVTLLVALAFWDHNPILALVILTVLYAGTAGALYSKLCRAQRDWKSLPATLEQLKKDRECLEKQLS